MMFQRTTLLLGDETLQRLQSARVIIFGIGGVGSWCAEALIRSGIHHLTIVDFDFVASSNLNRQIMATTTTIGSPKVQVLRQRLLDINPDADIMAIQEKFTEENADQFCLDTYDYIIDAIDSLNDKALLIRMACDTQATLLSSMGAALKLDPARIQVAEFWKVKGDPLARALRNKFKRTGQFPKRKFRCVYSDELLQNQFEVTPRANGTVVHITAAFGLRLAALVIQHIQV